MADCWCLLPQDREGAQTEEQWELSRFYPLLQVPDASLCNLLCTQTPVLRFLSSSIYYAGTAESWCK